VRGGGAWYTEVQGFAQGRALIEAQRRTRCSGMAQVLALVDDLFFQAKILETAKHLGIAVRTSTTSDALLAEIAKETPKLVIVDLNARGTPLRAIEKVHAGQPGLPLIAFLSHVQTDLAQQARAAGCTQVMPRSQFTHDLATILAQAKS
jgi:DNA-binding NarL/FixJ family response regulator